MNEATRLFGGEGQAEPVGLQLVRQGWIGMLQYHSDFSTFLRRREVTHLINSICVSPMTQLQAPKLLFSIFIATFVMTLERYTLKLLVDRTYPYSAIAIEILLCLSIAVYLLFGYLKSLLFVGSS